MNFITHEEWQNLDIFHPKDDYEDWRSLKWYNYYKTKWFYEQIAGQSSILEIGVRLGYSAYSFLYSPYCNSYTGIDIQKPIDGGMEFETFDWVRDKVFSKFPHFKKELIKMDSQKDKWPNENYGFIHIDGLHTYQGAYNDLNNAWEHLFGNGLIVLDDCTFILDVWKAGKQFCGEKNIPLVFSPSIRGDLLIWKV
jgi:hypothetical protein